MKLDSYMPVEIISGRNCLKENYSSVACLGKSCLIITGGLSAVKSGALADAEAVLKGLNIEYKIFNSITQNPYTQDCFDAGKTAAEMNADFIIGIGGGSPLDASKAAAIYASNPKMKPSEIYTRTDTNTPLPLVLVGTTAGTGSEVTGVSVLTDSENGMKRSISGKDCYAKTAFCDYGYTMSVPYDFTVSTALDALAHTVESYFSKVSNSMSELYAEKALPLLWENLKKLDKSKNTPDETMREELYIGSIYAGLALNITGTCFPHTMGYVLTEDFNIPHGKACTAFMTDCLNIAVRQLPEKAERLFSFAGTDFSEFTATVDRLTDVHISMTEKQIEQYSERWTAPVKNFNRTPGNFTKDTAVKILEKYLK